MMIVRSPLLIYLFIAVIFVVVVFVNGDHSPNHNISDAIEEGGVNDEISDDLNATISDQVEEYQEENENDKINDRLNDEAKKQHDDWVNEKEKDPSKCSPIDCGPFGKCLLDNTNQQYHCSCDIGYGGSDCAMVMEVCPGYIQALLPHVSVNTCFNGGRCVRLEGYGEGVYECNCNEANGDGNVDNGSDPAIAYTGYQCEYGAQVSCEINNLHSNFAYCVNNGYCRKMVHSNEKHVPCQCDDIQYEGRHCQYKVGTMPDDEKVYIELQLQKFNEQVEETNSKSTFQSWTTVDTSNTGKTAGQIILILFFVLLIIGILYWFCCKKTNRNNNDIEKNHTTDDIDNDVLPEHAPSLTIGDNNSPKNNDNNDNDSSADNNNNKNDDDNEIL